MVSYATSVVTRFQDQYALQTVKLPLKYTASDLHSELVSVNGTFKGNHLYSSQLASSAKVVLVEEGTYVEFVTFGIRNNGMTLLLTPVSHTNAQGLSFRTFSIELPHAVYSKECVDVRYFAAEKAVVIDFVSKTYLFITLKIRLQDFVVGKQPVLALDTFERWGHISVPFSFELKSSPFSIKTLDDSNVIVSLKNGGLLHFKRASPLHDFDVYSFMDDSSLIPLNLFDLFRSSKKGSKSRGSTTNVEGINSMAVVDVVPINDKTFVTLSISKEVNCWSLENHSQLAGSFLLGSPTNSNFWLSMIPRKYMQIVAGPDNKRYLLLHYSLPHDDISGYSFSMWEIIDNPDNFELIKLDNMLVTLSSPRAIFGNHRQDNLHNLNWFIQDFQAVYSAETSTFKVSILWKSSTLSILGSYDVTFPTGEITETVWSNISTSQNTILRPTVLDEFLSYRDLEFFQWKVLRSGIYDKATILSAISIFRHHSDLPPSEDISDDSISGVIYETMVATHRAKEYELKTCWYKFDALCEELKRTELEALTLDVLPTGQLISHLTNGIMEYRESHPYEEFLNSQTSLWTILDNLTNLLSSKSLYKIYESVIQLVNTKGHVSSDDASELYQTILSLKILAEDSQRIQTHLQTIPQVDELIQSFYNLNSDTSKSFPVHSGSSSSNFQKLLFVDSIFKLEESHEIVLLGLLVLFLVSEVDDAVLEVVNRITQVLANYTKLNIVIGASFVDTKPASPVVSNGLSKVTQSLLWEVMSTQSHSLPLISSGNNINNAFQSLIDFVNGANSEFVLQVILGLIGHDGGLLIEQEFFPRLSPLEPTDQFLKGLVYLIDGKPQEMYLIFSLVPPYALDKNIVEKLRTRLLTNKILALFLTTCFDGPVSYYHSLAQLTKAYGASISTQNHVLQNPNASLSNEYLKISIQFEFLAIDQLRQNASTDSQASDLQMYYIDIFDMGLGMGDYDVVCQALSNLKVAFDYETYVQKYIFKLASTSQLHHIFHHQPRDLYVDNYLLIDRILVSLAEAECNDIMRALVIHKVLFSWRLYGASGDDNAHKLADTRGACESLYWFIQRYKSGGTWKWSGSEDSKSIKLKILELYLIIVNCIKSFEDNDDKWLISIGKENTLVALDQLSLEYYGWFKELENDMLTE